MAFEISKREEKLLLQMSIERVINNTLGQTAYIDAHSKELKEFEALIEAADTNGQDWAELKELVCKLWDRERDRVQRKAYDLIPDIEMETIRLAYLDGRVIIVPKAP